MRVRNAHTARVDGIEPGAEGEVDESRSGVQVLLRAGFLVASLDGAEARALVEALPDAVAAPPAAPAIEAPAPAPAEPLSSRAQRRRAREEG